MVSLSLILANCVHFCSQETSFCVSSEIFITHCTHLESKPAKQGKHGYIMSPNDVQVDIQDRDWDDKPSFKTCWRSIKRLLRSAMFLRIKCEHDIQGRVFNVSMCVPYGEVCLGWDFRLSRMFATRRDLECWLWCNINQQSCVFCLSFICDHATTWTKSNLNGESNLNVSERTNVARILTNHRTIEQQDQLLINWLKKKRKKRIWSSWKLHFAWN